MVFDETRRPRRHRACGSPASSATSRAGSACPAASGPSGRRRRCTGWCSGRTLGRARRSWPCSTSRPGDARRVDLRPGPDRRERRAVRDRVGSASSAATPRRGRRATIERRMSRSSHAAAADRHRGRRRRSRGAAKGRRSWTPAAPSSVDTPTLCYADNLTPVNACRVCVVEVEGARVARARRAHAQAEDGMKVKTDTERVQHSRKLVMEFLASSVDVELTSPDCAPVDDRVPGATRSGSARGWSRLPAGERDARGPGHHHEPDDPTVAEGVCAAGQGRQRALRARLLALHPLLQVRRGVRRRRAEHVRDRRRRTRVRCPHLHRVRRPA